jgi:hypothetical protein
MLGWLNLEHSLNTAPVLMVKFSTWWFNNNTLQKFQVVHKLHPQGPAFVNDVKEREEIIKIATEALQAAAVPAVADAACSGSDPA